MKKSVASFICCSLEFSNMLGLFSLTFPKLSLCIIEWRLKRAQISVEIFESALLNCIMIQFINIFNCLVDAYVRQM